MKFIGVITDEPFKPLEVNEAREMGLVIPREVNALLNPQPGDALICVERPDGHFELIVVPEKDVPALERWLKKVEPPTH